MLFDASHWRAPLPTFLPLPRFLVGNLVRRLLWTSTSIATPLGYSYAGSILLPPDTGREDHDLAFTPSCSLAGSSVWKTGLTFSKADRLETLVAKAQLWMTLSAGYPFDLHHAEHGKVAGVVFANAGCRGMLELVIQYFTDGRYQASGGFSNSTSEKPSAALVPSFRYDAPVR